MHGGSNNLHQMWRWWSRSSYSEWRERHFVDIDDDLAESDAFNKIVEDKSYSNHLSNNALMLRQSLSLETIGNEWANLLFK